MMSGTNISTLRRGELLKKFRAEHAETVERTQGLLKEQKQMQQAICQFIRDKPKTVPEIAAHIGKPAYQVLWFVSTLKKYGIVAEGGMCEDYPMYTKVEGK